MANDPYSAVLESGYSGGEGGSGGKGQKASFMKSCASSFEREPFGVPSAFLRGEPRGYI